MARKKSAGEAQVTLGLYDSPLARGLRGAQAMLMKWGRTVSKMTGAIGGGLQNIGRGIGTLGNRLLGLGTASLAAFAYPIKAASDLQETMGKFDTVFGNSARDVQAWGDTLADEIGRGKTEIRKFLAANQDLLVPMGMNPKLATEFSKQIVQLTYDLASFNNMADADVHRDLQAALTGSGEVMKKYGVIVSAPATKQELINQGLDPKKATEAQKAQARLAIIMRGTTAAQGDAARTSGSFANQMKALKARLSDSAAVLGGALLPVLTPLVTRAAQFIEKIGAWAAANGQLVATIFKVAAGVTAAGAALTVLGPIITAVGTGIVAAGVAFAGLLATAGSLVGVLAAMATPLGAITAGLVALVATSLDATGTVGKLMESFSGLGETFRMAWGAIRAAITNGDLAGALEVATASLGVVWETGLLALQTAWQDNKNFMLDVWDQMLANIAQAFALIWNKIIDTVKSGASILGSIVGTALGPAAGNAAKAAAESAGDLKVDPEGTAAALDDIRRAKGDARRAASDEKLAAAQKRLADAQAKLQATLNEVNTRNSPAENLEALAAPKPREDAPEVPKPGTAADVSGAVAGTFSAVAVRGLSQGNAADRTAAATEATAKNTENVVAELRRSGPVFA
jgi:hypothetical protein